MSDHGTIITPDGKATVFMPRWFYGLALASCFAFGLLVGAVWL